MNNLFTGLITGLILPFIVLVCFYLLRDAGDTFGGFLKMTFENNILSKLISLAAVPDALLFFIFIWTDRLKSARGVIFALFLLCLFVIIIKYLI